MYKIKKPISDTQRADFIVEYNHNKGLKIEEGTDTYTDNDLTFKGEFLFALEPNEIMQTEEAEIDVPDVVEEGEEQTYHKETVEIYKPVVDPNWEEEQLTKAKAAKYNEANNGAKTFLESGNALFEFEEGKHIEATDGNIAKLTAYALAYVTGQLEPTETVVWNSKEDETVELTAEQIGNIVKGLGYVQAYVWSVQFPQYLQAIETAETIEEVQAINIEYYSEEPVKDEPIIEEEENE